MPKDENLLQTIRKRVAQAPQEPGIYKWIDESGRVLYVGKAKNLRKRLSSYVRAAPSRKAARGPPRGLYGRGREAALRGPWRQSFQTHIADFDVTVTTSELEALLLETNLIKQLRPKYNVLMKDDKNYLFIRISVQDEYPRVETIRRYEQDTAKYFGPYLNTYNVYQTLDMLHEVFQYRACKESISELNRKNGLAQLRPCLEHQIGRCNGLCTGAITKEEYRERIDKVIDFLKGNTDTVRAELHDRMQAAARDRQFELAAKLRNELAVIEGKTEQQVATDTTGEDSDIFGVSVLSGRAHVVILHRRNGHLIGDSHFALAGQAESVASVLEQFLPQYYDEGREVPPVILMPEALPEDGEIMEDLLEKRRGRSVRLIIPERGRKSRLLQLAERNAREKARQAELKWEAEEKNVKSALAELKEILKLPVLSKRIEGYDISHLGGTETVGCMVVIKDGKAANDQYRSFTIRTLKAGQIDDYAAIREVLSRRVRRLTEDLRAEEKQWNEKGITFGTSRKSEQQAILKIIESEPLSLCDYNWKQGKYFVARETDRIVGLSQLARHTEKIVELDSVWVDKEFRGERLGQFMIRAILRKVKKGKVYLATNTEMEEYYSQLGFRIIREPPATLMKTMEPRKKKQPAFENDIYMMWEAHQNKVDPSVTAKPDLIVIDGGKGQLSSAVEVLQKFQMDIPAIGLAKREEEIFVPGQNDPIPFPPESPAKYLLMRLRDEAHRFSNRHRETRLKNAVKASAFDGIPGIGEETKKKLLVKFGSFSAVQEAADEQLSDILTRSQLESLRQTRTL